MYVDVKYAARTQTNAGRWVYRERGHGGGCHYCGRFTDRDCAPTTCMACGTVQCHSNGAGRGACFVCHNGWLPGWSRDYRVQECGYRDCTEGAVSYAPRVGRVCHEHLDRATTRVSGRSVKLTAYIAGRIAHRNSGAGWEHFRFVT